MDLLTALKISISGFFVVFVALGLICFCIKILSMVIAFFDKPKIQNNEISEQNTPAIETNKIDDKDMVGFGELKLFGVDEKTAAMIMAIVSDESKIPLAELQFKSIKLLGN
jgi:Na+-transporting methylmalonyl-CoA/oxaloacetate decarboxylase gamma subunit